MQITLTSVSRFNKTAKTGKPYVSLSVKCNEYGDKYLSGFGSEDNQDWKVGDTVEVEVATKGDYLNFSTPKGAPTRQVASTNYQPALDTNRLEVKIDAVLNAINTLGGQITGVKSVLADILSKVDKVDLDAPPF